MIANAAHFEDDEGAADDVEEQRPLVEVRLADAADDDVVVLVVPAAVKQLGKILPREKPGDRIYFDRNFDLGGGVGGHNMAPCSQCGGK